MTLQQLLLPFLSRRFIARVLSTILCVTLIVVGPFSKSARQYALFAMTVKELVFSVQETLAQQIEATFLHLTGGFLGIGLSLLGHYFASLCAVDSSAARAISAVFLALICFGAGWLKSRLPRLTLSARIACFVSIWLLTLKSSDHKNIILTDGPVFVSIIITAASTSLVSSMLFLRWTSPQFSNDIIMAFVVLRCGLEQNIRNAFATDISSQPTNPRWLNNHTHDDLLKRSITLNAVYRQATFELRIGRVSIKSLKPLVGIIEHLRRELSWGIAAPRVYTNSPLDVEIMRKFQEPGEELGQAIIDSISILEQLVSTSFDNHFRPLPLEAELRSLAKARTRLTTALDQARVELNKICDDLLRSPTHEDIQFPQKVFNLCLFMISLLQMAQETHRALRVGEKVAGTYESSPLRLWHPRFSLAWLGVSPTTIILDERGTFLDNEPPDAASTLSFEETLQGIAERSHALSNSNRIDTKASIKLSQAKKTFSFTRAYKSISSLWNHPRVIQARLALSRCTRSLQHSPHLRHAFKNAVGVSLLSIPGFMPANSAGRAWFSSSYGPWMLISYVWVLETNTGATWRVAYLRLSGTVLGAIYACIASLICQRNPYGLVAAFALADLPISWIAIYTSFPSLGVVASITLPPILFTPYFHAISPSPLRLAILRSLLIIAGIISALLMNNFVFPRHCRVMFLDGASRSVGLLSKLYMSLSRDLFHPNQLLDNRETLKLELGIRKLLHRMNILVTTMNDELSLVPKPVRKYRQIVSLLQKLLDLLTGLRKVREHIPRKESVTDVAPHRRELVSCLCISLFASEQVFRGRQPLPQFLPSCRLALASLESRIKDRIRTSEAEKQASLGLPLIYALAELDVLADLVDTLEELLDVTRELFGTSLWLDSTPSNTLSHERFV
ncbi:hypothetical protein BD779DRAFT_1436676 [Infundibulicybe gibba]|nr:hypothetical protein BD779DRAFT_1436676 [Infundibulicybe gibba]